MRGHLRNIVQTKNAAGLFQPVGSASVYVYGLGTTTPITQTMYATETGSTVLTNPLTTDANGVFEAWIDGTQDVTTVCNGVSVDDEFSPDQTANVVRITDFSAHPSNTAATNLAKILKARDALESRGGGKMLVPAGSYAVGGSGAGTEILLISKSVIIEGEGFASKLVVDSGTPNTCDIIRFHSSANEAPFCGVRDLYVTHASGAGATVAYGRHTVNLDISESGKFIRQFQMERVWADGFSGRAVELTNPLPNANSFFTSGIRHCWLMGGIRLLNAGDSVGIEGNTISGANAGVEVSQVSGATNLTILGNNITSAGGGIWLKSGIKPVIRHNIVERATALVGGSGNAALIDIDGSITSVVNPTVSDNIVTSAGASVAFDLVRLGATSDPVVKHNTLSPSTGRVAISVTGSVSGLLDIEPNTNIGAGTMVSGVGYRRWGANGIASATTITLPAGGGDTFFLNGNTTVVTITARGTSDDVILWPTGTAAFSAAGNVVPRSTGASTVNVARRFIYSSALSLWSEVGG